MGRYLQKKTMREAISYDAHIMGDRFMFLLYLFLIKRINRFIMPLVSGMAAKPPRNAV